VIAKSSRSRASDRRSTGRPRGFTVHLDGEPPGHTHGIDIDETGHGTADYQRMYQLIRQPPPIGDRLFEIEFLDAGVEAYVFTFGRPRSKDHVSGNHNRSADRRARARRLRG
jgi:Thioredoxin like C-terminal domain